MKFLVLTPKGQLSRLQVKDGEAHAPEGEFQVWALQTGKQILFVDHTLHRAAKGMHLSGSYQTGALYAYSYDEMRRILTSHLGPSDMERARAAAEVNLKLRSERRQVYAHRASAVVVGVAKVLVHCTALTFKFVLRMIVFALLIRFVSKRK